MGHIQQNAEFAVREMLTNVGKKLFDKTNNNFVTAMDYLDDGSVIKLQLTFDIDNGEAIFDFT